MGTEVGAAGDELVVDGEVVEAEPEERVRVQDVRDEAVDAEMRRRGRVTHVRASAQHGTEVVEANRDDGGDDAGNGRERREQVAAA